MTHPVVRRSAGPFDVNLMLRESTDGALTTTGTYNGIAISETPVKGLPVRAVVPAVSATQGTTYLTQLDLILEAADTDADASYVPIGRFEPITAVGEYVQRVATQRAYLRLKAEVSGTTPDFGAVEVGTTIGGF